MVAPRKEVRRRFSGLPPFPRTAIEVNFAEYVVD
jgi:hypothetical protein